MYTKPIYYKIFSIIILVTTILSALCSMIVSIMFSCGLIAIPFPNTDINLYVGVFLAVFSVVSFVVSFFTGYMEFSSMFVFANMINHELSDTAEPFVKRGPFLSAKVYKGYGNVLFFINLFSCIVFAIINICTSSFSSCSLGVLAIPVIPLAIYAVSCLFTYIYYLLRYNSIGTLIDITSSKELNQSQIESLKEIKTGYLRGFCVFLFIVDVVIAIGTIVGLFFAFKPMADIFGVYFAIWAVVLSIFYLIVQLLTIAIYGCYFDNIAKMVEHHQIKHKLI